jgi:glucose/arabinose dehydrogenase
MHQLFGRGWNRRARLFAAPCAIAIFGACLAGCAPRGISVTFSKTPARGTTTIKVTVNTSGTITATSARIDSATATPVATSSAATFSFDLDTTPLANTTHTLFVTSQTSTGSLSDQFPFTVDNTPTLLPPGFQQSTAFSGLTQPTAVRFSPDGRVFVAEKSGLIKVFASVTAKTATVFADLRTEVYNAYDRGLLGIALDPSFPTNPYVYVLYTLDAPIGGTPPVWNDACPTPPGPDIDGCPVSARLSRLQAAGNVMTGTEQVLINDWCQQYSSHSIGDLVFGSDGALYASGGDGASFTMADYGQGGNPKNPCGDPPVPVGGTQTAPTAEGGALRSQDLRTTSDPTGLDGTVIRVDPATGAALPSNPNAANPDPNAARIVGYGMRNPFRFTVRPGTSELWIGDVGWSGTEEIDRVLTPTATPVRNFGWPCYEGTSRQASYNALSLNICNSLYASGTAISPYYSYRHSDSVVAGDGCPTGGSSITGGAFYPTTGGSYPAKYAGALFFADYTRRCIWAMLAGTNGLPDPTKIETFATGTIGAYSPVDLVTGPGGDLYYVDLVGGTIRRIHYYAGNRPPIARVTASPTTGPLPLTVAFDARSSTDADLDVLSYSWDLDGDGTFGDSNVPNPSFTYTTSGTRTVSVRVSDPFGGQDTETVQITAGNTPPKPTISAPGASLTWRVGQTISFAGSASDIQDGTIPAAQLSWRYEIQHCPTADTCHVHPGETYDGVDSGSFVAQNHEYPSHLRLYLTATDSGGLSATTFVDIYPQTNTLTLVSDPPGATLALGSGTGTAPFSTTVISDGTQSISAPDQTIDGQPYVFSGWSDGGAASHDIVVSEDTTMTATFVPASP